MALIVFLLAGCGKKKPEITTIAITKDGDIEHTMIEEFAEGSVDALKNMILEKVAAFNNHSADGGVKVSSIEETEGIVEVVMTYPDAAAFDGFMNMDVSALNPALRAVFFYGTVEDALEQGYDLDITLQSAKDEEEELRGKNDILEMGKNRLLIYDNAMNLGAPIQIDLPKKPLYLSDNVKVAGKKVVEISETDEVAYILLGK